MRTPVSAPTALGANAVAKPSVTRIAEEEVPVARRVGKSMVDGNGEPQGIPLLIFDDRSDGEMRATGSMAGAVNCAPITSALPFRTGMPLVPLATVAIDASIPEMLMERTVEGDCGT